MTICQTVHASEVRLSDACSEAAELFSQSVSVWFCGICKADGIFRTIENNVITLGQERTDDRTTVSELKEAIKEVKETLAAMNARLDQMCKEKGESTTQLHPARKQRRRPRPEKSNRGRRPPPEKK